MIGMTWTDEVHVNSGMILESISDGVFSVDKNLRICSFNHAAELITGVSRDEALGKRCKEVFRSNMCDKECFLEKTMSDGNGSNDSSIKITNKQKKELSIDISAAPLKNIHGDIVGCIGIFRDLRLVERLAGELTDCYYVGGMVSQNAAMKNIFDVIPKVAESTCSVLIEGETGTGKELLAREIHNQSRGKNLPFIAINCGALPDTLLESELFGYKAGAFTDATEDKPGHFVMAQGGTILLDEIGETSPAFQTRLLRVLEQKQVIPLGGIKPVQVDARVIAATNRSLIDLVDEGKFRQDLYFRIDIMLIKLPLLRERKEDIPLLIEHFIKRKNRSHQKKIEGIDKNILPYFMAYDYPGNVRELENIIERAHILCNNGIIHLDHLPDVLKNCALETETTTDPEPMSKLSEYQALLEALINCHSRVDAAKELGIHKSTLFRKMKKYGINFPINLSTT
ncbi:MAG: sigma 54-interacting transcriptional regulator [Deltaproteobacteria bacterium]|nr:sigma 54-interacting transcriptional regulator [Deltaproteobacteria bacterium]